MLSNDQESCNCPKVKCARHGNCEACEAFHNTGKKKPPYCMRKRAQSNKDGKPEMKRFSPALGLIFGVPAGALFGIILGQNMAVFAGIGAGIGLLCGACVSLVLSKEEDSDTK